MSLYGPSKSNESFTADKQPSLAFNQKLTKAITVWLLLCSTSEAIYFTAILLDEFSFNKFNLDQPYLLSMLAISFSLALSVTLAGYAFRAFQNATALMLIIFHVLVFIILQTISFSEVFKSFEKLQQGIDFIFFGSFVQTIPHFIPSFFFSKYHQSILIGSLGLVAMTTVLLLKNMRDIGTTKQNMLAKQSLAFTLPLPGLQFAYCCFLVFTLINESTSTLTSTNSSTALPATSIPSVIKPSLIREDKSESRNLVECVYSHGGIIQLESNQKCPPNYPN